MSSFKEAFPRSQFEIERFDEFEEAKCRLRKPWREPLAIQRPIHSRNGFFVRAEIPMERLLHFFDAGHVGPRGGTVQGLYGFSIAGTLLRMSWQAHRGGAGFLGFSLAAVGGTAGNEAEGKPSWAVRRRLRWYTHAVVWQSIWIGLMPLNAGLECTFIAAEKNVNRTIMCKDRMLDYPMIPLRYGGELR
jgi:hypothetical protein